MAVTVFRPDKNAAKPVVKPESTGIIAPPVINQNTLNDFNREWNPQMNTLDDNRVKLFIYSPKPIPDQVLRSYLYQFTTDFVDSVTSNKALSLEQAVSKMNSNNVPNINKLIQPDEGGKQVDLSNWNRLWTFTLIADYSQTRYAGIPAPHTKLIASGFFMNDEPGCRDSCGNFIINPNAILIFTHVTNIAVRQSNATTAASDGMFVSPCTWDFVGESVPQFYNEGMYLGTPSEILKEAKYNPPSGLDTSLVSLNLSNITDSRGMKSIPNDIKAPRAQLSDIMGGIDTAISNAEGERPVYDTRVTSDDFIDAPRRALDYAINNIPNSVFTNFNRGLDVSKPISMGELEEKYPRMEVYPCLVKQGLNYGWDTASQIAANSYGQVGPIVSPKQQWSSLASYVVQSVISMLGIATLAFSYRWRDGDGFVRGKQEAFQISRLNLMIDRGPNMIPQYANRLKSLLDEQLFEVIHDNCGEFDLNCMCDAAGTVLVDLQLCNWHDTQDGSFYQTDSKLGGILNPLIGIKDIISNNSTQLYNVTNLLTNGALADNALVNPPPISVPV